MIIWGKEEDDINWLASNPGLSSTIRGAATPSSLESGRQRMYWQTS